jgi:cytochrome c-type biogenesis protein CcmH/NrfG
MICHEQPAPSVVQALEISETLLHQLKRVAKANQKSAELEAEQLRQRLKQVETEPEILIIGLEHFHRKVLQPGNRVRRTLALATRVKRTLTKNGSEKKLWQKARKG